MEDYKTTHPFPKNPPMIVVLVIRVAWNLAMKYVVVASSCVAKHWSPLVVVVGDKGAMLLYQNVSLTDDDNQQVIDRGTLSPVCRTASLNSGMPYANKLDEAARNSKYYQAVTKTKEREKESFAHYGKYKRRQGRLSS